MLLISPLIEVLISKKLEQNVFPVDSQLKSLSKIIVTETHGNINIYKKGKVDYKTTVTVTKRNLHFKNN